MNRITKTLLLGLMALSVPREASALIMGGAGNQPVNDPGWPRGAAAIVNHPGRVAWWEGPPFGGGEWHSECRGDARALNAVLANFAALDVAAKRVVVHDGDGRSFWLSQERKPGDLVDPRIDWVFSVWRKASWEQLHNMPVDLNPTDARDASPPSQIDVFTSHIDWKTVDVPKGLKVYDQRLVAHGFKPEDGVVIEGDVKDVATGRPLTATIQIQRVEPQTKGGYLHPVVAKTKADARGRWVFKNTPVGWVRIVASADGYAPRIIGYDRFVDQPRWLSYKTGLARVSSISGRVNDESGKPLADVDVRLADVQAGPDGNYATPIAYHFKTDAEGRFKAEPVPTGRATIWVNKPGYVRPGLGQAVDVPKADVVLTMSRASSLRVTVDFADKPRPRGYIVKIEPEGGEVVGSSGGSGDIDARDQIRFDVLPPGRYIIRGRPNPGADREETEPLVVELKAGQASELTIKAD